MVALEHLVAGAGSARELSNKLRDTPDSHISALRAGKRGIGDALAAKLERAMGKPSGWMDSFPTEARTLTGQGLANFAPIHSPYVDWGVDMLDAAGGLMFWTTLPDNSMAPRAPQGKRVCFDRSRKPKPGDGVLVRDGEGMFMLRIYRARAGGHWSAAALNPAFHELDSERDGIEPR